MDYLNKYLLSDFTIFCLLCYIIYTYFIHPLLEKQLISQVRPDKTPLTTDSRKETNADAAGDILAGLKQKQKKLPTKYFYDKQGSQLFDEICKLEEYYPTRTEFSILQTNITEIVELIKPRSVMIELGSGSSTKTKILLNHLDDLAAYIPVDISSQYLNQSAQSLRLIYPDLKIVPLTADYTKNFILPDVGDPNAKKLVFFPGSTLGNFYPNEAIAFMQNMRKIIGSCGGVLIGIDLQKDPQVLNNAYNDSKGVTAAFNLNMLNHINNTVDADFDLAGFKHYAFYNQVEGRIEMHLISQFNQSVHIGGEEISIKKDEAILTEVSYKYTLEIFNNMVTEAGFTTKKVWLDPQKYFSVQYLTNG